MKTTLRILRCAFAAAAVLVTWQGSVAQTTDALFTHYYEVPAYYNAAATGRTDYVRIRGGGRLQWVGVHGAPRTFLITADMPLKLMGQRWGLGAVMQQESAGLYSNITAAVQASWHKRLGRGTLGAGLQIGIVNEGFKGSEVRLDMGDDYHSGTDDAIPTTDVSGTAFDMGVGVWYDHPLFWAGLSCAHVLNPTVTFTGEGGATAGSGSTTVTGEAKKYEFEVKRAIYFMAGSNISIKNTLFEVMPSVMAACDPSGTTTFQVTARTRWKKFLSAGLAYRYNDAVSVMLGGEYKNFYLGYSYDYPVTAIARASSGSHEVFAGYSLKLDLDKGPRHPHKSIRIM